ncbi:MAG: D-2-hydroxyacid dehydrogenase [Rhizobiaceae bacterium]
MTRIVFLDRGTIGPSVELRRPSFEHNWTEYERTRPDQVVERLEGAQIAICNKVPIGKDVIQRLPDLRMIAIPATGYDAFDLEACRAQSIVVSNVRGYATNTVPEHAFALILALRRGLVGYRQDVIDGEWQRADQFCFFNHPINDLAGSTLGIIGEGALGQGVAKLGQAFGMRTLFAAHKGVAGLGPLYTPFEEVIEESDVITLHSPLMPTTQNMIAAHEFGLMKRQPLLINCARGGLVNERDLVTAVKSSQVAGIGFDCLTSEPPREGNPLLEILDYPNVIVTPHTAWASDEAMLGLWNQVIGHVENYHRGTPTNALT